MVITVHAILSSFMVEIKDQFMKESDARNLARMLQVVRGLEEDIGIQSLSRTEKAVFTSIADLSANNTMGINVKHILAHPDLICMPTPTLYKCLRDLHSKGLLVKEGTQRLSLFKLT